MKFTFHHKKKKNVWCFNNFFKKLNFNVENVGISRVVMGLNNHKKPDRGQGLGEGNLVI